MLAEIVALLRSDPVIQGLLPEDPITGQAAVYTQWSLESKQPYVTVMYDETMVAQVSGAIADGSLSFNCWDSGSSLARVQAVGQRLVDMLDYRDLDTTRGHARLKVVSSGIIPEPEPNVVRWGVTVGTRMLRSATIAARVARDSSPGLVLVNINTGSSADLTALPGITAGNAQSVIDYRTDNGAFAAIEDILDVAGIGTRKYDQIKGLITV